MGGHPISAVKQCRAFCFPRSPVHWALWMHGLTRISRVANDGLLMKIYLPSTFANADLAPISRIVPPGGPALQDDVVAGVAFQNLPHADNIGYIIPTPVVRLFLNEVAQYGAYRGEWWMGYDERRGGDSSGATLDGNCGSDLAGFEVIPGLDILPWADLTEWSTSIAPGFFTLSHSPDSPLRLLLPGHHVPEP